MPRPAKFGVVADYHHFHLRDGEELGDVSDGWTVKATEDRVAAGDHVVGIGMVVDGEVAVTVEVLQSAPALDLAEADHATEASLHIVSGSLAVLGCTEEHRTAKRVKLENGWWRIRCLQSGLGRARESARILIWVDSGPRAPQVLKRWSPPPP